MARLTVPARPSHPATRVRPTPGSCRSEPGSRFPACNGVDVAGTDWRPISGPHHDGGDDFKHSDQEARIFKVCSHHGPLDDRTQGRTMGFGWEAD